MPNVSPAKIGAQIAFWLWLLCHNARHCLHTMTRETKRTISMTQPSSINRTLRYLLLAVFVGVPLANFGLQPPLSDGSQFADDPQTRVAAAGYAFAIWGVIFTGMLWFSGSLAIGNEPDSPSLRKAIVCLMIAGLASVAFVPISIYCNFTIGWLDIMAHLIPLAIASFFLRKHVTTVSSKPVSSLSRWSFFGPSMYFGWRRYAIWPSETHRDVGWVRR
jgi:hypothetical protein